MKIDDLGDRMRDLEAALDPCVLPGVWMVARLDGRNFARLTKETHPFEGPFDSRFHDFMTQTAEQLMSGCGLKVIYAYIQSDEMSLLFGPEEGGFGRRLGKLLSVLSGEASTRFSLLRGAGGVRLRNLVPARGGAHRRLLPLAGRGRPPQRPECPLLLAAPTAGPAGGRGRCRTAAPVRLGKHELLFREGIHFDSLPAWQKRGKGLYCDEHDRPGANPVTGEPTRARRRRIRRDLEPPVRDAYSAFLRGLIRSSG